jgi:hypothetical protein
MGRWSAVTITGRRGRQTTIISIYRVCDQKFASTGVKTAYRQQYIMAADLNITPNNPRQLLLDDLTITINTLRAKGQEIILLIDANESLTRHNSPFASWVSSIAMIDPITARHGPDNQPSSVDTGSTRIDYILISRNLAPYVTAAGILENMNSLTVITALYSLTSI